MNRILKTVYLSLFYFFLYLPIGILVVYSFNNARFSSFWHGATLKWYHFLFSDTALISITGHSFLIAALAASVATLIGALGSVAIFRYQFYGKKLLHTLIFILIIMPEVVFGISLLILFTLCKIQLGFLTLLIAHITFCLPFVVVTILGRLRGIDNKIFEAARDLGANDLIVFLRIILPLMAPALMAGWLLSFTLSMDDVIISFFVTGPSFQILPLYIYSQVRVGVSPEINALCTLIFVFTLILIVIAQLLLRYKKIKVNRKTS